MLSGAQVLPGSILEFSNDTATRQCEEHEQENSFNHEKQSDCNPLIRKGVQANTNKNNPE